jgi:CBS domain-containing protein
VTPNAPELTAREIMTTNVVTVLPQASVKTVAHLMQINRISGMPVVDHDRQVVGVVTEYDLLRMITSEPDVADGTVSEIMRTEVLTVSEETRVSDIAEILLSKRIRRVLVTRDGQLTGLVSRRDVVFTEGALRDLGSKTSP